MAETIVRVVSVNEGNLNWIAIRKDYAKDMLVYELWLRTPNSDEGELIGNIDPLYTTIERNKYIATFDMSQHPEQHPIDEYFFNLEEAQDFVESSYMAWRMVGTLENSDD